MSNTNKNYKITPLQRFWNLISLERKEVISIYFFSSLSGIVYLILPLGIQTIINQLFGGLVSTSMVVLIILVVLSVLFNGWLQIKQMKVNERVQRRIFTRFTLQFAHKIPRLDLMTIDDYYLPELVNRFFDTASLQKGLSKVLLDFPTASIQVIFSLALLSFYHPVFIVFGALLIILLSVILISTYPRGITTSLAESNIKYEVGYWLEEVARIIKTIKFMGKNDLPSRKADMLVSKYLDARDEHFRVLKIQYWAFVIFKVVITAALLIVGATLVIGQQINIGQFIASEIVIIMLLNSIEKIISSLDTVYDMLTSLEKVSKILDQPEEYIGGLNINEFIENKGISIKAEDLTFRFPDKENPVLEDLNFEVSSGEKVCIFGTQGSGKTMMLKIFTGAYLDYHGNLLFNNYPLGNYNLDELRKNIGVYLASADLFSGTLYENLTLGNKNIQTQEILDTCKQTGLLSFIKTNRDGLNMNINSLGKKLPQNMVNKILLTRALLTHPKLLLLEDCWSGLERIEQELMVENLTGPDCNFTLIAVTNDENFARHCDKIILLDEGKLVAFGSFETVSQTPEYNKMFKHLSL
jgi:ATP-binding cassette subfamily B protein